MHAAKKELWPRNIRYSQLFVAVRMLELKYMYQFSKSALNDFSEFFQEVVPDDNLMPKDFYSMKKLVHGLGLPVEVIHYYFNNYMIYWGADSDKLNYKLCVHDRYKPNRQKSSKKKVNFSYKKIHYFSLTPRLQRLYASSATASKMRLHVEHEIENGKMLHPSDVLACKLFDHKYEDFTAEVHDVRLGLCSDGF